MSDGFHTTGPAQVAKSDLPLNQTPLAITVVPRALLDSQQANSLADALQNVSGVAPGTYGRRGWDDLMIRGQTASDSLFLDGLRTAASNRVAEQIFGFDRIEVFKGPASLLYGQVLPGGLVNMVSKRPQATFFARTDVTVGSDGLRQGSFDINQPLAPDGLSAFRLNALSMNSDDPTDGVYSRDRWIAPSLSLKLGSRTDLVVLTSYQHRTYIRQQGLPWEGTVVGNPNGALRRSLFTGETGQQPYRGHQARAGYLLTHRFDDGWTLHQGFRWQDYGLNGEVVANNGFESDMRTLKRKATRQAWRGRTLVQDTYLSRNFDNGPIQHHVTVGLDAFKTWEWRKNTTCKAAALDVYAPVYTGVTCPDRPSTDTLNTVLSAGVYARDQILFGPRWQLLLGARRDHSQSDTLDDLRNTVSRSVDQANTGSAALMYELSPGIRPYMSFASSFYPNSGVDAQGRGFQPERGRQWEFGTKMDLVGGAASVTVAVYDLRRQNVLESDPINDDFDIAVGEERSRGGELNFSADLSRGLSVNAGYSYTDAIITDDGGQATSSTGQRLNNVPRHSGSLWLRYNPSMDGRGWSLSGGLRAMGERYSNGYTIPGYVLVDAGLGYRQAHWRYSLNAKNIFNTDYYAGGLSKAVALGDPRSLMFNVGFDY